MPTFATCPEEKHCSRCDTIKSIKDFAINNAKSDGRQAQCRACKKTTDATYYKKNQSVQRQRNKNNIEKVQTFIYEYLLSHPCVDCGESDPIVLEFDHLDPSTKERTISQLTGTVSITRVVKEIAKCQVRCSNCHRRITAQRGGHYRYRRSIKD